jgi:hypothetical protein
MCRIAQTLKIEAPQLQMEEWKGMANATTRKAAMDLKRLIIPTSKINADKTRRNFLPFIRLFANYKTVLPENLCQI